MEKRQISFSPPDITEAEVSAVADALRSGWITTGPRTKEFERNIAQFTGCNRAACLNSATACLETALRLLGIGEGDEVIVPAYTYTASASVVAHVNAKLVKSAFIPLITPPSLAPKPCAESATIATLPSAS